METPEKFKNLAEAVRNEVYGKDVREAIAKSIEETGTSSETAIKITEQLIDGSFDEAELTTEIEQRLEQLEQDYAPELSNVKSQLAQTATNLSQRGLNIWDFKEHIPMHNSLAQEQWDWTEAIKAAIQELKITKGKLIFPPGRYLHGNGEINKKPSGYTQDGTYEYDGVNYPKYVPNDGVAYPYYDTGTVKRPLGSQNIGEDIRLMFDGLEDIEIEGYGAIVQAHSDNSCIVNNGGFIFKNCTNVKVKGLVYDGNIQNRKPFLVDSGGYNFQHGFAVSDDCKNISFEDVQSNRTVMDGFNIHRRVENVTVRNCKAIENYRQGMTIGDTISVTVEGGEYSRSGTIFGTAPMDGIDIEVWEETPSRYNHFKNVMFRDNVGNGLSLQKGTQDSIVEGCTFHNNYLREDQRATKNNTIKNNTFINSRAISYSAGSYIDDNIFYFDESQGALLLYELAIDSRDLSEGINARAGRIKGNTIIVSDDLAQSGSKEVVGGVRLNGLRKFEGNTLINAYSTIPTPIVRGVPAKFIDNKVKYIGSLDDAGRVDGGVINYGNQVDNVYSKRSSTPYDQDRGLGNEGIISDETDTGRKTNRHTRTLIASSNSETSGRNSSVISSGTDSVVYPNENTGANATILSSRATKNEDNYVVVGGYRGVADPNTAQTADRKWTLSSQTGDITHAGTINSGHNFSDFAELFPNLTGIEQGNGLLQTLEGHGVRPAQQGENVLGVTTATAGLVLGDTPFSWQGRWLKDEFGAYIYKDILDFGWTPDEDKGETEEDRPWITVPKENPDYDPSQKQLTRKERPSEWSVVGLVGQVYVRVTEDCEPMDYIKAYRDGIGTTSEEKTNIQVMKITTEFDKAKGYAVAYCLLK